jgi:hypothetical protein
MENKTKENNLKNIIIKELDDKISIELLAMYLSKTYFFTKKELEKTPKNSLSYDYKEGMHEAIRTIIEIYFTDFEDSGELKHD